MNLVEIYFVIAFGTAVAGIVRMYGKIKDDPKATALYDKLLSMTGGKTGTFIVLAFMAVINGIVWPITLYMWAKSALKGRNKLIK